MWLGIRYFSICGRAFGFHGLAHSSCAVASQSVTLLANCLSTGAAWLFTAKPNHLGRA